MPATVRGKEGKLMSLGPRHTENTPVALPNPPKGSTRPLKRPFTTASAVTINVSVW